MDRVKGVAKGGWHPPGKHGGKESWRGDFKGINQVASLVGKGKAPAANAEEHNSRPLASLKDPSAFGPPPKRVDYHGGAAVPSALTPDRRGLGAPLTVEEIQVAKQAEERKQAVESDVQETALPKVPFRADTTGVSTNKLPKPPVRQIEQSYPSNPTSTSQKPKPALPPRLPPRQNSAASSYGLSSPVANNSPPAAVPAHDGLLNQGSLKRLGSAGVSLPAFGIGLQNETANPWQDEPSSADAPRQSTLESTKVPAMNGLQAKFPRMSPSSTGPDPSSKGTTFAEKQAAFKTASSFRDDPSSVSLSDAKTAATTANNFRERHGERVSAGWQGANGLNKKYGVTTKMNNYASGTSASPVQNSPSSPSALDSFSPTAFRKAPPPPPSRTVVGSDISVRSPPPVPLASKPKA
ncbi:hypothetical protein MMC06_003421 [Schaereria dolodes]|nr:hypothetical protein [Schaereria dolodes]